MVVWAPRLHPLGDVWLHTYQNWMLTFLLFLASEETITSKCPATWDGWQCWPEGGVPGQVEYSPCPNYIYFHSMDQFSCGSKWIWPLHLLFNSPHADTIHSFGLQSTENPNCIRSIGTPWQSISLAQTHAAKRQASKVLASQYWRPIFRGRIFKLKLKFYYANRPCRFQK